MYRYINVVNKIFPSRECRERCFNYIMKNLNGEDLNSEKLKSKKKTAKKINGQNSRTWRIPEVGKRNANLS